MYYIIYFDFNQVNDSKKKTSSTVGMKTSVETSELLKYRVQKCVPERTKEIIEVFFFTINVFINY